MDFLISLLTAMILAGCGAATSMQAVATFSEPDTTTEALAWDPPGELDQPITIEAETEEGEPLRGLFFPAPLDGYLAWWVRTCGEMTARQAIEIQLLERAFSESLRKSRESVHHR